MLVGSDGPRLSVHSPLVGPDSAKPTTTNFAATMCFAKDSCERVLFLRAAPHHRCFRSFHTLTATTFGWGVMMLRIPTIRKTGCFATGLCAMSLENSRTRVGGRAYRVSRKKKGAPFADPWRDSSEWIPDDTRTAWYGISNH